MKRLIILLTICISLKLGAQTHSSYSGIQFEQSLTWDQVKEKAKKENKYIFLDCFATWCAPCKAMDQTVYSLKDVGDYINENFIAVKLQMDTTKKDNSEIRNWFVNAQFIQKQYQVNEYPTYLFFAPGGQIVHRASGYLPPKDFLSLVTDVSDPSKQYYTLINNYRKGSEQYEMLGDLAMAVSRFGDKKLADSIACDFKIGYLDKLSGEKLCTKRNLQFIASFSELINSKDRFFNLFYNDGDAVDKIMNEIDAAYGDYSKKMVEYVVYKEEISPKLQFWKKKKSGVKSPPWELLKTAILKKYNKCDVGHLISDARLSYYREINDWRTYVNLRDEQIKTRPPASGIDILWLNGYAWDLFLHCDDRLALNRALSWSELSIKLKKMQEPDHNVQYQGTRAYLLYKLGRVNEAIDQEEEALQLANADARKMGKTTSDAAIECQEVIKRMKEGRKIWPLN